jgi:hypothetical protein
LRKEIKLLVLLVALFGFVVVPAAARPDDRIDPPPPPVPDYILWYDHEPLVTYAVGGMVGTVEHSDADGTASGGYFSPVIDLRILVGQQFRLEVGTSEFGITVPDYVQRRGRISFDLHISYSIVSFPNYYILPWGDLILLGYGFSTISIQLVQIEHSYTATYEKVIATLKQDGAYDGEWKTGSLDFDLDDTYVTDYMVPVGVASYSFEVRVTMFHSSIAGCYASMDMDVAKIMVWI